MKDLHFGGKHSLFLILVLLFFLVGSFDLVNLDSFLYKGICTVFSPITTSPCTDYYDLPIWNVYLSVAILAALYYVHAEIKVSNKHLSSHKK